MDLQFAAGAGVAGSIVANRLSAHFSVLLLERGGEPNPLTAVPGMEQSMLSRPEVDYIYKTVPQNGSCFSCNNRDMIWNSGKGLGGGSILNTMVYIRGHRFDFDLWSYLTKDDRWAYKNLLKYFKRSEGYCELCDSPRGTKPSIDPEYHSSFGELPVRPPALSPMVPEFLKALEWAGVPTADLNAPYSAAITDVTSYTQKKGRRVTTYNAFVEPILDTRPKLKVLKYARVIRVLFEPGTNHAVGVQYERFGRIQVAMARREVILSSGAIASPKILMLSGIGPASDLNRLNVPVRANLPVGKNLQDHVGTFLGPFLVDKPVSILADRDLTEDAAQQFLENGTGPFTLPFARAVSLWTSTRALSSGEGQWPDIQVGMASNGIASDMDQTSARVYNLNPTVMKAFFDPIKGKDAFSLLVNFGRPRSRGVLTLRSADYNDEPEIDPRYYEDVGQNDITVTVEGIQRALYLAENAPTYKRLRSRLSPIPFPTCKGHQFRSDAYFECLARQYTLTLHHFSGLTAFRRTCAMGPADSPEAVVDAELRVIGVKRLRVIDASVMPFITTTNTASAAMVIGEIGSEFVIRAHIFEAEGNGDDV